MGSNLQGCTHAIIFSMTAPARARSFLPSVPRYTYAQSPY